MKKIVMTLTAISLLLSPMAFAKGGKNGSNKGSSGMQKSGPQYQHKNQNQYKYQHKNQGQNQQNQYQQKNKEYYDYGISEKKGGK